MFRPGLAKLSQARSAAEGRTRDRNVCMYVHETDSHRGRNGCRTEDAMRCSFAATAFTGAMYKVWWLVTVKLFFCLGVTRYRGTISRSLKPACAPRVHSVAVRGRITVPRNAEKGAQVSRSRGLAVRSGFSSSLSHSRFSPVLFDSARTPAVLAARRRRCGRHASGSMLTGR